MRVAQRMISRNYKRQINSSMQKQSDALERSESGLAFKKLSDNVSAGSRAMHIQEQRYAAEQQLNNVKDLLAEQKSIDSNLSSIHSILQTVQERVLTGMSEDWGADARAVIAQEIGQKMEQLLQFANSQYAGHTLFGGTNNSVPPFTVSDEGKLQFNGIDVDQIFKSALDGKYYYTETNENGDWKYTINGEDYFSSDGVTFTREIGKQYTITGDDGTVYTSTDPAGPFDDGSGNTFKLGANGGYEEVYIGGVLYTNDGNGIYTNAVNGTIYQSEDGLNFVEVQDTNGDGTQYDPVGTDPITFAAPVEESITVSFVSDGEGGFSRIVVGNVEYERNADGVYESTDPTVTDSYMLDADGKYVLVKQGSNPPEPAAGAEAFEITPEAVVREVPNSGATFADIGLGLKIKSSDIMADPRTAYQVSFSGLAIMGCAGVSYDNPPTHPGDIIGAKNGSVVSGNLYDLLGQIKNALSPNFDKNTLDDLFTQLVDLTDEVGMVRTDLGNRMEYLELTETRLDDDIFNMTTLETDLVSSDPAMEAIKMKECEYVWLALMQLGSKVLPASLLDFIS